MRRLLGTPRHFKISIISYTSLDNFSYSISIPDMGFYELNHATSAFSSVIVEGSGDHVEEASIYVYYDGDASLSFSHYDFSNVTYTPTTQFQAE
ncbi:MAG: hypothetical protein LBB45_07575 [Methanobrevibacter sp.]|jgi:hypothetical protein|nr:hypothetical protein [Candidatus Methanovirga basalitermitum]